MTDPLEQMLHRAHRAELQPLAQLLRVNPEGLGLGDLARILAAQVRRVGSHGLGNVFFRKGEGLPYEAIVAAAAKARGIPMTTPEETELALAHSWFTARWEAALPAERATVWGELGLGDAPPVTASEAVGVARERLGRSFDYALTGVNHVMRNPFGWMAFGALLVHPAGCLMRPFLVFFLPYFAWRNLRPSEEYVGAVMMEVARIRQRVLHRVTIGVVGSPSTGKDAAIKALFGIDTGNISPVAGSTKEVAIQRLPGATALFIVNTPGMGDVMEHVTEEARQVLDHIDLYLYIVNAEGGVQARELADYRRCVETGKPVLALVNKVDVLRPRDKDRYLEDARAKLGAPAANFLPVAFDPLPQLAPGPIGLEAVHGWIAARLVALGKDPGELPPLPAPPSPALLSEVPPAPPTETP
ncbi:MAG: GTPase [Pseudomonadota bacterium]|nr:GTPase [Pseudomonadota bacterium]